MASDEESSQASDTEEEDEEEEEEEEIGLYGCTDILMFSACVPGSGRTRRSDSGRGWFMGRVLNPRAKWVEEWNRVYLLVCAAGLLVDPLFFYPISISENFVCIFIDGWFAITVTALRCMTDALHVWNMWLQFKTAKLRHFSSSHYNNITGEYDDGGDETDSEESQSLWHRSTSTTTSTTTRTTGPVHSKKDFFLSLFVILPIPQVVLWVVIPSLLHKGSTTFVMTVMLITFLFQYLPKIWHFVRFLRRMRYLSGYIFGTIWWSFALTLMAYFVAAHATGACWYLLGIQRAAECLGEECNSTPGCGPRILACQEPIYYGTGMVIRDSLRLAWGENSQVRSNCIDSSNNFNYGAYAWGVQLFTNSSRLEKILFPLFWGLMTLSTFGNLICSTEWLEILFNIIVLSSGLLLVTMLIGNIKNFLSGMTSKKQKKQTGIRIMEGWMKNRRLPQEFRQRVRQYERQRWVAMRGVDETEIIRNLPEGLRREIKYNLCRDLVKQVPLFQHMDELVLENICDRVKSLILPKGETIIREGDPVQRMIFVVRGHLESSQVLRDGGKSSCMLGPGNFSGDELLSWCLRRPLVERLPSSSSTLVTLGTTEAFGLEAEDVKYVTQHFRYTFANEKLRRSTRYYSTGWRTWAAVAIQLAWRRHRHRLTLMSLSFTRPRKPLSRCSSLGEERMRLYTALLASPKPNQDDFSF